MEVFGAIVNVGSLLEIIKTVGFWANDSIKAKDERALLLHGLDRLIAILHRIEQMCRDAQPGDEWYEGLSELVRTSGKLTPEGKYEPHPSHGSETSLSKLYAILQELTVELSPAPGSKIKAYMQRLWYHWEKERYKALLGEFDRCRDEIGFVLDVGHFRNSRAIRQEGRETLSQVSEIKSRMSALEG